jgi:hypothetical protein
MTALTQDPEAPLDGVVADRVVRAKRIHGGVAERRCIDTRSIDISSCRIAVIAAAIVLSSIAVGCGDGDRVARTTEQAPITAPTTSTPAPPPTTTTAPAPVPTTPATTPTTPPTGGAGDEGGIHVPAHFEVSGAQVTPESIEVPAFLTIELSVKSVDGHAHVMSVTTTTGQVRVPVAAGATATRTLQGLRPGEYPISLDGAVTDARLRVRR